MGNVLCLLLGIVLALATIGLAVRRGLRPMAAASAYRNTAWRLGLDADTRGVSVQGFLDDRRIFVGEVYTPHRQRQRAQVRAILDLAVPLGVGLRVHPRQTRRLDRFRRTRTEGLNVGDPEIDEHLALAAIEPERALALFTDAVRDAVCTLRVHTDDIEITDHWLALDLPRHPTSGPRLDALIDDLLAAATALETARGHLSVSPDVVDWLPDWEALAATHGLALHPTLPRLTGTQRDHPIEVHAVRTESGYGIDVRVTFPEHPVTGLRLAPQRDAEGFWAVGQDIRVGAPAFDDAFVVQGYDPHVIRRLLPEAAQAAMLALRTRGELHVHDRALELHGAEAGRDGLEPLLTACLDAATTLRWPA